MTQERERATLPARRPTRDPNRFPRLKTATSGIMSLAFDRCPHMATAYTAQLNCGCTRTDKRETPIPTKSRTSDSLATLPLRPSTRLMVSTSPTSTLPSFVSPFPSPFCKIYLTKLKQIQLLVTLMTGTQERSGSNFPTQSN